jgi:hypothetical protein
MVHSFREKVEERVHQFCNIFQESTMCPIQEISEVICKFTLAFSEQMNHSMKEEVLESEVHEKESYLRWILN